jgi:hypothetical protein
VVGRGCACQACAGGVRDRGVCASGGCAMMWVVGVLVCMVIIWCVP